MERLEILYNLNGKHKEADAIKTKRLLLELKIRKKK